MPIGTGLAHLWNRAFEGKSYPYKVVQFNPRTGLYRTLATYSTREEAENHPEGTHIIQTHQWWDGYQMASGEDMARGAAAGYLLGGPAGAAMGALVRGSGNRKARWVRLASPVIYEKTESPHASGVRAVREVLGDAS